jgi:hypothetical protein
MHVNLILNVAVTKAGKKSILTSHLNLSITLNQTYFMPNKVQLTSMPDQ